MILQRGLIRGKPLTVRFVVVSVLVVSVALAILSVLLASRQTTLLARRLRDQVAGKARHVRNTAQAQLGREVAAALRYVADQQRTRPDTHLDPAEFAPRWIDGLYVWDGTQIATLAAPVDAPEGFADLLQEHLTARRLHPSGSWQSEPSRAVWVYDTIEPPGPRRGPPERRFSLVPIAVACLEALDATGRPVFYAANIDCWRAKAVLVDPQLAVGDGLEVVPVHEATAPWSQAVEAVLHYWSVQPAQAVLADQRNAVIRHTFAYSGLTILTLLTVLAAMWFLGRTVRREVALAELKSNFVADVSHELKTPLALIRMFGETLQSGRVASEAKRQEYYAIISRESTRLANLINNILDFSRIEAGHKEYTLLPTDVGRVVRETYDAYRTELDHDDFKHQLTIADNLPRIDADPDAISQVLVNLIGNAMKYSGQERYLGIDVSRDTRRGRRGVLIAVRDRGIGIRPEDRAHLFEGFFRASDERVRNKAGAGLGLALVKNIVDAHHGSLEVESRLVKGSTFRVFLPASERPEVSAREGASPPSQAE